MERIQAGVNVFDAAGLGLFCVAGERGQGVEADGLAVVTAFVLRLLAMKFHWRAPRAWNRRSTVREE